MTRITLLLSLLLPAFASDALADNPTSATVALTPAQKRPSAAYVEVLGKGGLWGLGYDYEFHPQLALGASASFYTLDGEQVLSFSPYLAIYLLGRGHHRWFVQGGPQLVYLRTPSPVPEWSGTSTTGYGAELCSGYEYRSRALVRVFAMGTVGRGGYAPWMGVSLGWTF